MFEPCFLPVESIPVPKAFGKVSLATTACRASRQAMAGAGTCQAIKASRAHRHLSTLSCIVSGCATEAGRKRWPLGIGSSRCFCIMLRCEISFAFQTSVCQHGTDAVATVFVTAVVAARHQQVACCEVAWGHREQHSIWTAMLLQHTGSRSAARPGSPKWPSAPQLRKRLKSASRLASCAGSVPGYLAITRRISSVVSKASYLPEASQQHAMDATRFHGN